MACVTIAQQVGLSIFGIILNWGAGRAVSDVLKLSAVFNVFSTAEARTAQRFSARLFSPRSSRLSGLRDATLG
jgi:hypothetical protein